MPSATATSAGKKASKAASSSAKEAPSELLQQISTLQQTLASSSDLNPLADLISIAKQHSLLSNPPVQPDTNADENNKRALKERQHSAKALHRCIHILARSFKALCADDRILLDNQIDPEGYIGPGGGSGVVKRNEAEKAVAGWIRQRWNETIELLCALLNHDLVELRSTSLELLMELQVAASSSLSRLNAAAAAAAMVGNPSAAAAGPSSNAGAKSQMPAQWSLSPWRALMASLVAGPPTLSKLGNGESESKRTVVRDEGVAADVREKFAENGMQEYDDVRFAVLREAADLNNFLIDELSVPLASASLKKGKKKASGAPKITEDGGSDDGAGNDDELDMQGWFSESDDEGVSVHKRKVHEKQAVEGLGAAAKAAGSRRRRKDVSFHEGLHRIDIQKAAFSRAWSDLLLPRRVVEEASASASSAKGSAGELVGGELSLAATHEILVRLHAQILPHLTRPTMLHDFLVGCLDSRGGATALLALNAIFTLVTRHNLDYPQFYTRLYGLLDASVLHMRYRSRFLRLLDVFLSSTHLSAALVASFAKRLSRLSLRAPPAAIASVVPFVWNLLKRHPRCLGMIHKEWDGDRLNIGPAGVADPFNADETDPLKTNAIDSSLWELAAFGASLAAAAPRAQMGSSEWLAAAPPEKGGETHYLGSVTSLAKILAQPFTKERYELDDFLDITYGTLFETETAKTLVRDSEKGGKRKPRPDPVVAYSLPGGYGGGGTADSYIVTAVDRVDLLPTEAARVRAKRSQEKVEAEEEKEAQREREEWVKKMRESGVNPEEEDEQDREAREAIESLRRAERAKRRRVDRTGSQDVCARLFNFG
ncbi:Maturation and nuclear export of 40S ribosomal subunits interacting protein [Thecaphora frezii]